MKSPLLWAGILAILVLTAGLIAPFFIDWTKHRAAIEAYGTELTGRSVEVAGGVSVRLLPFPTVRLADVRIGGLPGENMPDLLVVDAVEIRLALPPLLRGQIAVTEALLERPLLNLERLEDGAWTWSLSPASSRVGRVPVEEVSLDRVTVTEGTLFLHDRRRGGTARLDRVNMQLSAGSLIGPYRMSGTADYGGEALHFSAATGKSRPGEPVTFSLRAAPVDDPGFTYAITGSTGRSGEEPAFTGTIVIERVAQRGPDVEPVHQGVNQEAKGNKGIEPAPVSIRANVTGEEDRLVLDDIEIAVGDVTDVARLIRGTAELSLDRTISVRAELEASRASAETLLGDQENLSLEPDRLLRAASALVEGMPDGLFLSIGFKTTFLELKGSTIENFRLAVDLDGDRLAIRRLEGVAPGRARTSASALFVGGLGTPQLAGDFAVEAVDGAAFLAWARPGSDAILEGRRTAARLALEGRFDIAPNRFSLYDTAFSLDGAAGTAQIGFSEAERRSWTLRIEADTLDLDRYLGDREHEAVKERLSAWLTGSLEAIDREWLETTDAQVLVRLDRIAHGGVSASDIAIDLALASGDIDIRAFEIGSIAEARIEASGLVRAVTSRPEGALTASIEADDPVPFLRLVGLAEDGRAARGWASGLGAVALSATVEAVPAASGVSGAVRIEGRAGTTDVDARGSFRGSLEDLTAGDLALSARLANPEAAALLAQLAPGATVYVAASEPALLSIQADGRLTGRYTLTVDADLFDARGTLKLDAREEDGERAYRGNVTLLAPDPRALLSAFGLGGEEIGPEDVVAIDAALEGRGDEWRLGTIRGSVAGTSLSGALDIDWSTGVPDIAGTLELSRLSLPWLLGQVLLGDRVEAVALADAALGRRPAWPAVPFDAGRLDAVSARLDIRARELLVGEMLTLEEAGFALTLGSGKLAVADVRGTGFGEDVRLGFAAEDLGTELAVTGEFDLPRLALAHFLDVDTGSPAIEGSLRASGRFSGTGRSPAGLVASLRGEGRYAIDHGLVNGISPTRFSAALRDVDTPDDLDHIIASDLRGGAMRFEAGEAAFAIEDGLARFDPLAIDSQSADGTVTTYFDLGSGLLDLSFALALKGYETRPEIEMSLSGPPGSLARAYDTSRLRADLVVKVLEESVEKLEELQREEERLIEEERRAQEAALQAEADARRAAAEEEMRRRAEEEQARLEAEEEQARQKAEEGERRRAEEAAHADDAGESPGARSGDAPAPSGSVIEITPIAPPDTSWYEQPVTPEPGTYPDVKPQPAAPAQDTGRLVPDIPEADPLQSPATLPEPKAGETGTAAVTPPAQAPPAVQQSANPAREPTRSGPLSILDRFFGEPKAPPARPSKPPDYSRALNR